MVYFMENPSISGLKFRSAPHFREPQYENMEHMGKRWGQLQVTFLEAEEHMDHLPPIWVGKVGVDLVQDIIKSTSKKYQFNMSSSRHQQIWDMMRYG